MSEPTGNIKHSKYFGSMKPRRSKQTRKVLFGGYGGGNSGGYGGGNSGGYGGYGGYGGSEPNSSFTNKSSGAEGWEDRSYGNSSENAEYESGRIRRKRSVSNESNTSNEES